MMLYVLLAVIGVLTGVALAYTLKKLSWAMIDTRNETFAVQIVENTGRIVRYRFEPTPGDGWGRVYIDEFSEEMPPPHDWNTVSDFETTEPPRITKLPRLE